MQESAGGIEKEYVITEINVDSYTGIAEIMKIGIEDGKIKIWN